jgi:uncharacterized protein with WD repeat
MKLQLKSYQILLTKNSQNQSSLIWYFLNLPLQDCYCLSVCVADDMSRVRNMERLSEVMFCSF